MSHPPVADKVICVDFDGTLFPWGEFHSDAPPLDGAVEFMKALRDAGWKIVIFTSRMSQTWWRGEGWLSVMPDPHDIPELEEEWAASVMDRLDKWGIPWDGVTAEKVPAEYYIDDKAIRFENNWPEIQRRVLG